MVRLRVVGLSAPYRSGLRDGWAWALNRAKEVGFSLTRNSNPVEVDRFLSRVVQEAFDEGERQYKVTLAIVAVQRKLCISGSLLRATWTAMKGWKSLRPSRPRVPVTRWILEAMVLVGLMEGAECRGAARKEWWSAALGWWLAFEGLLRPVEVLRLQRKHLVFPEDALTGPDPNLVVVIEEPKTKRVWNKQFVVCTEPGLIQWLQWWAQQMRPNDFLVCMSRHSWSRRLLAVCNSLKLEDVGYTLSSFRSGGATYQFRQHGNFSVLQFKGRWKSAATVQFYIQGAMAAHATCAAGAEAAERVRFVRAGSQWLERVPGQTAARLLRP